jgi:hypothetical protein
MNESFAKLLIEIEDFKSVKDEYEIGLDKREKEIVFMSRFIKR